MNKKAIIFKYFKYFFDQFDPQELSSIFNEDLKFKGPFFSFSSKEEYINSLINDPPLNTKYEIINIYEDNNSVCVLYTFKKEKITCEMSQYFLFENNKIKEIKLIFDSKKFHF